MLQAPDHIVVGTPASLRSRSIHEPVGGKLRTAAIGIKLQGERAGGEGPRRPLDRERHIPPTVAAEIDGRRLERPIGFRRDRDPRAFHALDVALPGQRLVRAAGVGRILVPHLPHEQCRHVAEPDANPLAAGVARGDHQVHRLVEPAILAGHHDRPQPRRAGPQRHGPGRPGRIRSAVVAERPHDQLRWLARGKPLDLGGHNELPAAIEFGDAADHFDTPTRCRCGRRILPRHPPGQPRRGDAHPRRRRKSAPGRDQSRCRQNEALGGEELVEAGQADERRQHPREPDGRRAIHHPLVGNARQPASGPAPERLHHCLRRLARPLLDEDGVDEVVVEFGMIPLERPGGIDEVHAIPHERHDPADRGHGHRRQACGQPHPAGPGRQSPGQAPVLDQDARQDPGHGPDRDGQQKRRHRHALHVRNRRGEPAGEILLRLGALGRIAAPRPNRERIARLIRHAGHGLTPPRSSRRRSRLAPAGGQPRPATTAAGKNSVDRSSILPSFSV